MNFIEASKLASKGYHIKRPYWGYSCIGKHEKILVWVWTSNGNPYIPKIDDILADDWTVDKDEEDEE